ncbi:carboxylesterase family protein [uncultured Ilumatobacter sp.]|uniref:carboxylesterase family protein n=1 Tax=uncultured Ilumatobacter sp. TaxID=879968 RepID=UPI00374F4939
MTQGERPIVETDRGPVWGLHEHGLGVFKAILYAAPPTGRRRWQPPQPPDLWTGPLDASEFARRHRKLRTNSNSTLPRAKIV